MKIAIAGDSAGLPLVNILLPHLQARTGLEVTDLSQPPAGDKEYYANLAERVALAVRAGEYERAILICGTGIGVAMSANKVPGIRAAQTHDTYSAERAAKSNNAQIITLGALVTGPSLAKMLVDIWLANQFQGGNSARKVEKIEAARFAV